MHFRLYSLRASVACGVQRCQAMVKSRATLCHLFLLIAGCAEEHTRAMDPPRDAAVISVPSDAEVGPLTPDASTAPLTHDAASAELTRDAGPAVLGEHQTDAGELPGKSDAAIVVQSDAEVQGACDPARCPSSEQGDACCRDGHCAVDVGRGCGVPPAVEPAETCHRGTCPATKLGFGCCASSSLCGVQLTSCVTHAPARGAGCAATSAAEIAQQCDALPVDCIYRDVESCFGPIQLSGVLKECSAPFEQCPAAADVLPVGSGSSCAYVVGARAVAGRCCYVTRERFCPV